ncbi:suppressor of fused domain protein [Nioella aestuarii]|uniref:suppressor of fused domain protein n=1 Tax=Nioella aestuarii TaxID=1662864 RepID=UPI003D7FC53D
MKFLKKIFGGSGKPTPTNGSSPASASRGTEPLAQTSHQAIRDRLTQAFGTQPFLFHELISDVVPVDILCFAPKDARDHWVFVTLGMSNERMAVPQNGDPKIWGRAELMIGLHSEWGDRVVEIMQQRRNEDAATWWPIRYLKHYARYPHSAGAFLADGHTLSSPDGAPYSDETGMNAAMISYPTILPEDAVRFDLPNGDKVTILGLVYLYPAELEHKTNVGLDTFCLDLEEQGVSEVIYPDRRSMVGSG